MTKRLLIAPIAALLLTACATQPYQDPYGDPYGQPYPGQPYPPEQPYPPYPPQQPYPPYPPQPYPPQQAYPPGADRSCPITRSGNWTAHINRMPGPNARPTLIVSGDVVVPTGGYSVGFDPQLIVRESYPAQAVAVLQPRPPVGGATQAVMTHQVRWEWPVTQQIGSLEIVCGSQTLARISPVESAY